MEQFYFELATVIRYRYGWRRNDFPELDRLGLVPLTFYMRPNVKTVLEWFFLKKKMLLIVLHFIKAVLFTMK